MLDDSDSVSMSDSSFSSNDSFDDVFADVTDEEIDQPPYSPITSSDSEDDDQMEHVDAANPLPSQSVSAPASVQDSTCSPSCPLSYKIVGDNVDKNITPRYIRSTSNQKVKSLHYYHSYAVRDRIDVSKLPNEISPTCFPSPETRAKSLLPSRADDDALIANIKVLYSRVLVNILPFFDVAFSDLIVNHIQHRHSSEMSSKSCIVSL